MKTLFLLILLTRATFTQAQTSALLPAYFSLKDALVQGNSATAVAQAGEFITALNAAETKITSKQKTEILAQSARIAKSKDIKIQREHFALLSSQMISLAKSSKLSQTPVYEMYCPMKKSSWLSAEQPVKNPYYGNSMLTCGKVIAIIE